MCNAAKYRFDVWHRGSLNVLDCSAGYGELYMFARILGDTWSKRKENGSKDATRPQISVM